MDLRHASWRNFPALMCHATQRQLLEEARELKIQHEERALYRWRPNLPDQLWLHLIATPIWRWMVHTETAPTLCLSFIV
jgi:hypothetical protein